MLSYLFMYGYVGRRTRSSRGALVVGSPQEVSKKILAQQGIFGQQRFLVQISVGAMPRRDILHAIELLGARVAPVVRRNTSRNED